MLYRCRIAGASPVIHQSSLGVDTRSPISREISAITTKKGSNRTEADDDRLRELECVRALWLDQADKPAIPAEAIRSAIETGARKRKQGAQVREGLIVLSSAFEYDVDRYGRTLEQLGRTTQFVVPVVVKRNRIMRTRAKFDPPWACKFTVDVDEELIDRDQLMEWLDIAGRRIGIGDWRPEKSGVYGRFQTESVVEA